MQTHIPVHTAVPSGGWLQGWLAYSEEFEAPRSYFLYSMLTCAAAAVNRRVRVNKGRKPAPFTNLYTLLIGPSGSRKNDAIDESLGMILEAVPETPVLPDDFSMSMLVGELAEAADPDVGRGKSSGLVIAYEFSDLIGGSEYRLENTRIMAKLYDSPSHFRRRTRKYDNEELIDAYVSIVAASDMGWLIDSASTLAGGMLRRLLTVMEPGPKHFKHAPRADEELWRSLAEVLKVRLRPEAFRDVEMELTASADKAMEKWYYETMVPLVQNAGDREGKFASTMHVQAYKLAAMVHLIEGHKPIDRLDDECVRVGQKLVGLLWPGTVQAYAALVGTPHAKLREAVMQQIKAYGKVPMMALIKHVLFTTGATAREVKDAITTLLAYGVIRNEGGFVEVV